jgi:soluble lytic murein transglycosylase-like protein
MRSILSALAVAALLTLAVPASAAEAAKRSTATGDPCANRLCTKYERGTPSCWKRGTRTKIARCFIYRASRHYGESTRLALQIAYRESRFNWRATNSSSGAAGLYQFMPGTWANTPYRRYSPYHPKWSALAAMWMWKRGGYGHWSTM